MFKKFLLFIFLASTVVSLQAQDVLPKGFAPGEADDMQQLKEFLDTYPFAGIASPPTSPVRTMGEWEELEAIAITWTSFKPTLAEIVRHSQEECEVLIICASEASAKAELANYGVTLNSNVKFLEVGSDGYDSVWMRDYGGNPVYTNDVDSLLLIDWIYNRPWRPNDDVIPEQVADFYNLPLHTTTECPEDLVNTGGNFMSDGMGTGFSSTLILEENEPFNNYGVCPKTEAEIDQIMADYMGLDRYIKFDALPFDGINHIDMHMKLLDEETILVGEFPTGVSDGPQIEANLQYLLDNHKTSFGNDYKFVRVPMPSCSNGNWPDDCQGAEYRTYANAMFVNKTILVPVYGIPLDNQALAIWEDAMPGYNVVGIDCTDIIFSGGAIHCITKEVGAKDPLWIAHSRLDTVCVDEDAQVSAIIKHRSGIQEAKVFYTTDLNAGYQSMDMTPAADDEWTAALPDFQEGSQVYYYIQATSTSGKQINRPMPAPEGYFKFTVSESCLVSSNVDPVLIRTNIKDIFPNPAQAITAISVYNEAAQEAFISVNDLAGRAIETVFEGQLPMGDSNYFIDAADYESGIYFVRLQTATQNIVKKLIVK